MESTLKQKIHLITGKGGVGKSAVAMSLARALANKGEKTILAELGEHSYFHFALGLRSTYEPIQIQQNLDYSLWNGESCLREYVQYLVKVPRIANMFFDNKVMRSFIKAAPGLKELAVLGKLTSGIRGWGPKFDYQNVVVDAYSSGHFMALLKAPQGLGEIIESGPMGDQSRYIFKVLCDPDYCEYTIVSLPEEMPTSESLELSGDIEELTGQKPNIILNKYYNFESSEIKNTDFPLAKYMDQLNSRSNESRVSLESALGKVKTLPYVKSSKASEIIARLEKDF